MTQDGLIVVSQMPLIENRGLASRSDSFLCNIMGGYLQLKLVSCLRGNVIRLRISHLGCIQAWEINEPTVI